MSNVTSIPPEELEELEGYRVMGCSIKNVREVYYQVGNETNGRKTRHIRSWVEVQAKSKGMALSTVHTPAALDSLIGLFLKWQDFRSQTTADIL